MLANLESPEKLGQADFSLELQKECDELAQSITSMEYQLKSHVGEKNDWYRQCSFACDVATKKLKTNRHIITVITRMAGAIAAHNATIAKAEARVAEAQKAAERDAERTRRTEAFQQERLAAAIAKTERHNISMQEDLVFMKAYKKAAKDKLGMTLHMEIIESAKALLASGWTPPA